MVLIKTALLLETSTVWLPSSTLWKVILSSQTNERLIPKTGRGMGQFRHIDSVTSPKDGGPPSQLCAYICGLDKRGRVRRQETELPWEGGQLLTDGQRRNGALPVYSEPPGYGCPRHTRPAPDATQRSPEKPEAPLPHPIS